MKHFLLLRQTTTDEKTAAYLDELIGENEKIRPVVQSGNEMMNLILNSKLSGAAFIAADGAVQSLRRHNLIGQVHNLPEVYGFVIADGDMQLRVGIFWNGTALPGRFFCLLFHRFPRLQAQFTSQDAERSGGIFVKKPKSTPASSAGSISNLNAELTGVGPS